MFHPALIPFQESGLYEYKTFGVMADLDPEICAQVYVDWEYRKVWDTYVLGQCLHYPCVLSNGVKQSVLSFYLSFYMCMVFRACVLCVCRSVCLSVHLSLCQQEYCDVSVSLSVTKLKYSNMQLD